MTGEMYLSEMLWRCRTRLFRETGFQATKMLRLFLRRRNHEKADT